MKKIKISPYNDKEYKCKFCDATTGTASSAYMLVHPCKGFGGRYVNFDGEQPAVIKPFELTSKYNNKIERGEKYERKPNKEN
jgi:hypothetical protein